jgi:hypothetical protein
MEDDVRQILIEKLGPDVRLGEVCSTPTGWLVSSADRENFVLSSERGNYFAPEKSCCASDQNLHGQATKLRKNPLKDKGSQFAKVVNTVQDRGAA